MSSTYHDITRSTVESHREVAHLAELAKLVLEVLLGSLLVQAGHDNDPSLDG